VAAKWRYIKLTAKDWLYPGLPGSEIEIDYPIHCAVIGDGQAIHSQFLGPGDELRDGAHAIEEAIFGMNMKMSKHKDTAPLIEVTLLYHKTLAKP
jgi:hypothetical protein